MWAYQPSRLCECCAASWRPAPVAMRITSGTVNWPPDMCGIVAALLTIWSSASRLKLTVMISTIGRMPAMRRADAGADEGRLRQRRVADALRAELLQQALGDGVAAAVAADVLAHQEDALVARSASRSAWRGLAVGQPIVGGAVGSSRHLGVDEPGQVLDGLQRCRPRRRRPRRRSRRRPRPRVPARSSSSSSPVGPQPRSRGASIGSRSFQRSISALSR